MLKVLTNSLPLLTLSAVQDCFLAYQVQALRFFEKGQAYGGSNDTDR